MAHFAILCPEAGGHMFPMGSLGLALRRRGHQVTLVAREKAADMAEQMELAFHPLPCDGKEPKKRPVQVRLAAAVRMGWAMALQTRFTWRAEMILAGAPEALRELNVDAVLVDQTIIAGGSVAAHLGLPYATVCSALMWHEEEDVPPPYTGWSYSTSRRARLRNRCGYRAWWQYLRPAIRVLNTQRRQWGLPPVKRTSDLLSPYAQFSQLCRELDFPRRELSDACHYVGSLASARPPRDDDFPWDRLDGRPLIFGSLGTVRTGRDWKVFRKIATACAGLDAQLVISLGRWQGDGDQMREKLGSLDGDPVVVDFAPQLALLDRAAVMITHAGQNTVLETLSRGVPMVAMPRSADQPALASRVDYSGVGLRVSFHRSSSQQLGDAVRRVLTEDSFRQRAGQMQQHLQTAGGAPGAAEIMERVLTAGSSFP